MDFERNNNQQVVIKQVVCVEFNHKNRNASIMCKKKYQTNRKTKYSNHNMKNTEIPLGSLVRETTLDNSTSQSGYKRYLADGKMH